MATKKTAPKKTPAKKAAKKTAKAKTPAKPKTAKKVATKAKAPAKKSGEFRPEDLAKVKKPHAKPKASKQPVLDVEVTTYARRADAVRALHRIVKNNDDLVTPIGDRFTFDEFVARGIADLEPENAGPLVRNDEGSSSAAKVYDSGSNSPKTTEAKTVNTEAQASTSETVSSEPAATSVKAQAEERKAKADADRKAKADAKAKAKEERDAKRAQEKTESQAKREAEKTERAAKRDAEKADLNAQREAKREAKREAETKAKQDREIKRATEKAVREAKRDEQATMKAQTKAEKDAKRAATQAEKDAQRAKREAERAEARAHRDANIRNGIRLPGPNSKFARLWDIITSLYNGVGAFPSLQTYQAAISHLNYDEGGNDSTRITAYYDYKMYHGIQGRYVDPKADDAGSTSDASAESSNGSVAQSDGLAA